MCLLIVASRVVPGVPLLVAANRDERYGRPAQAVTVLRAAGPRILGGRDELAGGTWLAVNEHGLVAGLTNQPVAGRDPTRRSRGELPLAFAAYPDAATAVAQILPRLRPDDYNACWMLVGDRRTLFSVDLTGGGHAVAEELGPGRYVLENVPLRAGSAKQRRVAALADAAAGAGGVAAVAAGVAGGRDMAARLASVLCDHEPAGGDRPGPPGCPPRPAALSAACVHTPGYGTRSAMTVQIAGPGRPAVRVAAGPPCQVPLRDVSGLWAAPVYGAPAVPGTPGVRAPAPGPVAGASGVRASATGDPGPGGRSRGMRGGAVPPDAADQVNTR